MINKISCILLLGGICLAQIAHANNRRFTPPYMLERATLLAKQFRAQIENEVRLKEELLDTEESRIFTISDDLFNNILHQATIRANKEMILQQATQLISRLEQCVNKSDIEQQKLADLQMAYIQLRKTAQKCVPNYILPPSQVE